MSSFLERTQKLKTMEDHIRLHYAFTVDALSQRLGVSRRTTIRMIDELRAMGIKVQYCRKRRRYFVES
jgi:predicted DNA-binding transcriptional regulator YafY